MQPGDDFFHAVQTGDLAFLPHPEWINARRADGISAVLLAVYYGQREAAQVLVDRGAHLSIFEAAAVGEVNAAQSALEEDPAAINSFSADGFQPLGLAAFFGQKAVAELLLRAGAQVNTTSRNGLAVAPINSAAAGEQLEIVRLLLEYGADPNIAQGEGFVPLHAAAENGQVEMIQLLLAAGADPHSRTSDGRTPRDLALAGGHAQAADLLADLD